MGTTPVPKLSVLARGGEMLHKEQPRMQLDEAFQQWKTAQPQSCLFSHPLARMDERPRGFCFNDGCN